jgi:FeS assembly protein SufD
MAERPTSAQSEPPSAGPAAGSPSGIAGGIEAGTSLPGERLSGPGTRGGVDARPAPVASFDVADFPVPTGREEDWRFTPLDRLGGLLGDVPADGNVEVSWTGEAAVERVSRDDARVGSAFIPRDRASAIAFARSEKPLVISVPAEAEGITSTVTLRGNGGVAYDHLVVDIGSLATATVVLDHVGSATFGANVEVLVGDGAALTLVSLQDWADDAVHAGHHAVRLGRDARVRGIHVTLGGDLVRLLPRVDFTGPGGDVELLGLAFADAGQHLEHRLLVEHAVPHCRSRVTYKGALQGEGAHTVWIGDVIIRHAAIGTDTYELNRNLLLTDGARADSVPNLEIETGEVTGAGHASATGRFDDEQLFYLQSRGIPADVARRLVVRGFFADVISRIEVPELRDRLTAAIEAELEQVGG